MPMNWSFYYGATNAQFTSVSRAAVNQYRFSNSNTWNQPPCNWCGALEITQQHVCMLDLPEILRRYRRHL